MNILPLSPIDLAATHDAAFTESRAWTAKEFSDLIENRFTHLFGNRVCFAVVQVIANEAELLTIATHPDHQRQGLARDCMDMWQAAVAGFGATQAFLDVAADNHAAVGLYESCGFVTCGRRSGYYRRAGGIQVDAIQMERHLP